MPDKPLSVRIPDQQSLAVGIIARAEGVTRSEVVRAAVTDYTTRKLADEHFHKRLDRTLEEEEKEIARFRKMQP